MATKNRHQRRAAARNTSVSVSDTARRDASYDAGSTGGRRTYSWRAGQWGPNASLNPVAQRLRDRSRDAARQDGWAKSAINTLVSQIVGTGIMPRSTCGDETVRQQLQDLWIRWTDDADADGACDFYGLQRLAVQAMVEGGDCFTRLRYRRPEDGLDVPLQLQLHEAEMVPADKTETLTGGGRIIGGIELDRIGRRTAYHFHRSHPHDYSSDAGLSRVPAEYVAHLYQLNRPGQLRGEPWLTRALIHLRELAAYGDAELIRKQTAATFVGFVRRAAEETGSVMGAGAPNDAGIASACLEPGSFHYLKPGEEITFTQPIDVGGSYDPFMSWQLRQIAVSAGILYEQLTGDLSTANDRTLRWATEDFRRQVQQWQHHVVVHQFCRPIWKAFIDAAVLAGALQLPRGFDVSSLYASVRWVPQGWNYLHPVQDVQARKAEVDAGFRSRTDVILERGDDPAQVDAERLADEARYPSKSADTAAPAATANDKNEDENG